MLKIIELKMILKKIMVFFVLQLIEIVSQWQKHLKQLKYRYLKRELVNIQFSVSGSRFSVLTLYPSHFNSLYPTSDSLKN